MPSRRLRYEVRRRFRLLVALFCTEKVSDHRYRLPGCISFLERVRFFIRFSPEPGISVWIPWISGWPTNPYA